MILQCDEGKHVTLSFDYSGGLSEGNKEQYILCWLNLLMKNNDDIYCGESAGPSSNNHHVMYFSWQWFVQGAPFFPPEGCIH